ncbi:hypothetical protein [Candidatus Spongiihabitans sp.]|uniref:hypothetical protein n=1 Tax=Candidatus Spongiihabitans sp. TaxID=3101308 RepID=UPI003C6FCC32
MKKSILIMFSIAFLSSCAGVNIKPITITEDGSSHGTGNNLDGYILYAPKVFVVVKNIENDCKITSFQMPDYNKPFTLNLKSGLGKIDTTIEIKDGWMLRLDAGEHQS